MTIKEILQKNASKKNALYITKNLIKNKKDIELLFIIIKENNYPISWRAAWTLEVAHGMYPEKIEFLIPKIISYSLICRDNSIKRHFIKILSQLDAKEIPTRDLGNLIDMCYKSFTSATDAVAIKVYSMQLIYNISNIEIDLKPELYLSIKELLNHNSAGFYARGIKIMGMLEKEIKKSGTRPDLFN